VERGEKQQSFVGRRRTKTENQTKQNGKRERVFFKSGDSSHDDAVERDRERKKQEQLISHARMRREGEGSHR